MRDIHSKLVGLLLENLKQHCHVSSTAMETEVAALIAWISFNIIYLAVILYFVLILPALDYLRAILSH